MENKSQKYKFALIIGLFGGMVLLFWLASSGGNFAVLNPKGQVGLKERDLMVNAVLLLLIGAIPVYLLSLWLMVKHRFLKAEEKPASDNPENSKIQLLVWALPAAVILALSVVNWQSTHQLDPFKPLDSDLKPINVQVIALRWKWLFIYPDFNIASVNYVQFPKSVPINFQLTADAPMSSFWIPQLGGQMYAMTGMSTKLHLQANEIGDYQGSSAEVSGPGFAGMKFIAKAASQEDFEQWVRSIKQSANIFNSESELNMQEYHQLSAPSENHPVVFYSSVEKDLYNQIIAKYTTPRDK